MNKKWGYKIIYRPKTYTPEQFMGELNLLGGFGWELVQTHFLTDAFVLFLKCELSRNTED